MTRRHARRRDDRAPLLRSLTAAAQQRAADGVALNDEGLPQYSTFSLCAIDPATGQSGASVTTRVPFVGRAVPHVRAGVGAVCTQASTMVEYGPRGLDLLAKGVEPQAVLAQLLADDEQRESRQVGMIDMKGRAAAHTGKQNGNWAGSRQGKNYTVQANIMVGPEVVEAVATTFEATRRHRHAARRADDPGDGSRLREGRRSPLGQPAVGRDQDCRPERSRPRQRPHHAGDRSRRESRAGRRDEADLLHDRPPPRLSQLLESRRARRHRAEADAARARLLAAVARGLSRSAAVDQHAEDAGAAEDRSARSTTSSPPRRARGRPTTPATSRRSTTKRSRRSTNSGTTRTWTTRATRRAWSTRG